MRSAFMRIEKISIKYFSFIFAILILSLLFSAQELKVYNNQQLDSAQNFNSRSDIKIPEINIKTYALIIDGLVEKPISLNYESLLALPHEKIVAKVWCSNEENGFWEMNSLWEGIPVVELINLAKPLKEAKTIIIYSIDGYKQVLLLKDLTKAKAILADKVNSATLTPKTGFPFILVQPDKNGMFWSRWVTRLELSNRGKPKMNMIKKKALEKDYKLYNKKHPEKPLVFEE